MRAADEDAHASADQPVSPVLPPTPVPPGPPQSRHPRQGRQRRSAISVVAAVLLVAVLGARIVHLRTLPRTSQRPLRPPVVLRVARDGQSCGPTMCSLADELCPVSVAWSPDDAEVAIVSTCEGHDLPNTFEKLLLYDARSGQLLHQIALYELIPRLENAPRPGRTTSLCTGISPTPTVVGYSAIWLPRGRELAIPFFYTFATGALISQPSQLCSGWNGLLLLDPATGGAHATFVVVDTHSSVVVAGPCYTLWDLRTGLPVPVRYDTSTAGQFYCCLPPALSYTWTSGGSLTPTMPLPTGARSSGTSCSAPGDPDRGTPFTIWQPGVIQRITPVDPLSARLLPDIYYFGSDGPLTAASADGRYIASGISFGGIQVPTGHKPASAASLARAQLTGAPLLPVPGGVFAQRVEALPVPFQPSPQTAPIAETAGQTVLWRPDGRVVAATEVIPQRVDRDHAPPPPSLTLYACGTGHTLASFKPVADPSGNRSLFDAVELARWSPDSKYLLFLSGAVGTATIRGPGALPG